jgi:DNA-directed RNA polymerase subunit RPC12/RpoP
MTYGTPSTGTIASGVAAPADAPAAGQPPVRLFREEAQVEAVACPSCGGPITKGAFGTTQKIVCPYCGSELLPEPGGALSIMLEARRQQRASLLPLHLRGELDGATWEVIGIMWREVHADGSTYPWQEFLLYNPYLGFRYLLFFLYDGHWALGRPLGSAPRIGRWFSRPVAESNGKRYRHFQNSVARVVYVEGEFPWQVRVGDVANVDDYVAPPLGVSVEATQDENGMDIAYTAMEHLEPDTVWTAFKLQGSPPSMSGVGPYRPNRWTQGRAVTWISFAAMFVLWTIISIAYAGSRQSKVVFQADAPITDTITQEIDLGPSDEVSTVEVELSARGLSNAWAFTEIILVPHDRDEAIGFGLEVDQWSGVEGGESWSEGSSRRTEAVGGVPGGKYTLQVVPQAGSGTSTTPPAGVTYHIVVRRDVVLAQYILIPMFVILAFPLTLGLFGLITEGQRWKNSDYAPSS